MSEESLVQSREAKAGVRDLLYQARLPGEQGTRGIPHPQAVTTEPPSTQGCFVGTFLLTGRGNHRGRTAFPPKMWRSWETGSEKRKKRKERMGGNGFSSEAAFREPVTC